MFKRQPFTFLGYRKSGSFILYRTLFKCFDVGEPWLVLKLLAFDCKELIDSGCRCFGKSIGQRFA